MKPLPAPVQRVCGHCGGGLLAEHQPWCSQGKARTPPAVPQSSDISLIALFEQYCIQHDEQIHRIATLDDPDDMAVAFARAGVYLDCAERLHTTITKLENARSTTAS